MRKIYILSAQITFLVTGFRKIIPLSSMIIFIRPESKITP